MYDEVQPLFLNLCCVGRTRLEPERLLEALLEVEAEAGRVRDERPVGRTRGERREEGKRYAPRRLDLDLLLYGEATIDRPGLTVPHPRMTERPFVLVPLAELAPEWVHPGTGRTIAELAREMGREGLRRAGERLPEPGRDPAGPDPGGDGCAEGKRGASP